MLKTLHWLQKFTASRCVLSLLWQHDSWSSTFSKQGGSKIGGGAKYQDQPSLSRATLPSTDRPGPSTERTCCYLRILLILLMVKRNPNISPPWIHKTSWNSVDKCKQWVKTLNHQPYISRLRQISELSTVRLHWLNFGDGKNVQRIRKLHFWPRWIGPSANPFSPQQDDTHAIFKWNSSWLECPKHVHKTEIGSSAPKQESKWTYQNIYDVKEINHVRGCTKNHVMHKQWHAKSWAHQRYIKLDQEAEVSLNSALYLKPFSFLTPVGDFKGCVVECNW